MDFRAMVSSLALAVGNLLPAFSTLLKLVDSVLRTVDGSEKRFNEQQIFDLLK